MKRRYLIWCICLLAWMISAGALADSKFDAFSRASDVLLADVAAWLEIPGAEYKRPVMRHETDDAFYAVHGPNGTENEFGSLFMQAGYNAADFQDPVTVIYGSSKVPGTPFRNLQETYSGSFEECREILLHTRTDTLRYRVFAAVPYSSIHILHYYDFTVQRRFDAFFNSVYATRLLGMHLDEAARPEFGDRVLILSTGIRGDNMQRYLVLAKLVN